MIRTPINPRTAPAGTAPSSNGTPRSAITVVGPGLVPAAGDPDPLDRKDRTGTARRFLAAEFAHPEGTTLVRAQQSLFHWKGAAYAPVDPDSMRSQVRMWLDGHSVVTRVGDRDTVAPYKPSRADVAEVLEAVHDLTYSDASPPSWLGAADGLPDPKSLIVCGNGIVDLAPSPPRVLPLTPKLFTTTAVPFAYDPEAPPPVEWLKFLNTVARGDREFVEALQQWFGYSLTADTSQQKILLLVGPPRSGKGTIARVLTNLIGLANCAAPTLASLGTNFGLAPLLNKRLAVIGDARLSGRTDTAMVVERLLSISGEDAIDVDRKYLPPITTRLGTRVVVLTNELPRLNDPSGAVASRFVVLMLRDSHLGREDTGLTDRLLAELPGILLWAIEGWRRLREAGAFAEPAASREAVEELAAAVSPIRAFLGDWCKLGKEQAVPTADLFDAWRAWCDEQGRSDTGTVQRFGVDLRAALPAVKARQGRDGEERLRRYAGVGLTLAAAESMRVWRAKREASNRK